MFIGHEQAMGMITEGQRAAKTGAGGRQGVRKLEKSPKKQGLLRFLDSPFGLVVWFAALKRRNFTGLQAFPAYVEGEHVSGRGFVACAPAVI